MTLNKSFHHIVRSEEFERLARAHAVAVRWGMVRTELYFTARLVLMGGWRDDHGKWRRDDAPAAGIGEPF